jgi:hypothetical protein
MLMLPSVMEARLFAFCTSLIALFFQGDAPGLGESVYDFDSVIIYYLPGTTGWVPPSVLWNPQVQSGGGGFGVQNNQFGFDITGSSNLVVVIEATTSLSNPTWVPLQTNTLNGSSLYFTDPQWTNYSSRFYRVTWP